MKKKLSHLFYSIVLIMMFLPLNGYVLGDSTGGDTYTFKIADKQFPIVFEQNTLSDEYKQIINEDLNLIFEQWYKIQT